MIWVVLIIALFLWFKFSSNSSFVAKKFKQGNCIVWGKKRKGKDLLFQKVIVKRKKEKYQTNYPKEFGYRYKQIAQINMNDLSVYPNTYESLIANVIKKIPYYRELEKVDTYISDGGIYLPSQYNHILNKLYPSMPIFYSVIGHLRDSNIHVNYNGHITRLWDKLREQADDYFKVERTIWIFGLIAFTKVRYYEEYNTAEAGVLPMKKGFMNKDQKALYEQFKAQYGEIKRFWIVSFSKQVHYDTRYFRRLFYEEKDFDVS